MLDIGFDIGGTTVKAGALKNGRVLKKAVYPTPFGDPDALIALIRRAAEELCAGEPVAALGVTVPGSVSKDGGIIDAWNIGVRDLPLKTLLKGEVAAERYIVRNDADAAGGYSAPAADAPSAEPQAATFTQVESDELPF